MMNFIIFALVLAVALTVAQIMGGLLMLNIMFSEKFMRNYTKRVKEMTEIIIEEMEE